MRGEFRPNHGLGAAGRDVPAEAGAPVSTERGRGRRRGRGPALEVLVAVGVGGGLGTLGRYELSVALPAHRGAFPWAVFIVNVVGAFGLGLVTTLALERWAPRRWVRPLLGIGVCGGLTTFSTWVVDSVRLADAARLATATVDLAATVVAGFVALVLGVWVVRWLSWGRSGA